MTKNLSPWYNRKETVETHVLNFMHEDRHELSSVNRSQISIRVITDRNKTIKRAEVTSRLILERNYLTEEVNFIKEDMVKKGYKVLKNYIESYKQQAREAGIEVED